MKTFSWIPVWEYAKQVGTSQQNVYRWLREGKIPSEYQKRETITKERISIRSDFER